jgi:hypothetical protein
VARDYKRLSRKARHLIRRLRHAKFRSEQQALHHELQHEINRRWGSRRKARPVVPGHPGRHRPLTRRAKQILSRLRKTKVWSAQRRLLDELAREMEYGKRLAERARKAAATARKKAKAAAKRTRRGAKRTWNRAAPATARAARATRRTVNKGQERLLTRAERKQAGRGPRKPRLRDGWNRATRRLRRRNRQVPRPVPVTRTPAPARRAPRLNRPVRAPRSSRPRRAPARTR